MPTFCLKQRLFSKTRYSHFVKKNVHSLENPMFSFNLYQFLYGKPLLSCPHLVKMTSILSKLHYIMGQMVNRMSFFADFS